MQNEAKISKRLMDSSKKKLLLAFVSSITIPLLPTTVYAEAVQLKIDHSLPTLQPLAQAQSLATFQSLQVVPEGFLIFTQGQAIGVEVQPILDRQTIRIDFIGARLAPDFSVPPNLNLGHYGVRTFSIVNLNTSPSIVQLRLQVDNLDAQWRVLPHEAGWLIAPPTDTPRTPISTLPGVAKAQTEPSDAPSIPVVAEETAPNPNLGQTEPLTSQELAQEETSPLLGSPLSPLDARHPRFPTAQHLRQGEVLFSPNNRLYFLPGDIEDEGTAAYPNVGFTWGITNGLELTLVNQRVDTGSPGEQGPFDASRNVGDDNRFLSEQELTLELKQRLWQNSAQSQALSAVLSLSVGDRSFRFRRNGQIVDEGVRDGLVPALQVPYTAAVGDRLVLTFSPTVAFFDEENALHLHQPPIDDADEFGTTFGLAGAASYLLSERLTLWGDVFAPLTGNNSIDRDDGQPARAIAFNAGVRYLVNPRLAIDLFASNTLGSVAPLSLTADEDSTAFGAGVTYLPDLFAANRRYPDSFTGEVQEPQKLPLAGFSYFDGGVLPSGQFLFSIGGGSQGLLTALQYSPLRDLELGIYLDSVAGEIDESEQGISGKIRLLNQAEGAPLTASVAVTFGITNEPFVNFFNNDADTFDRRDLDESLPFFLEIDDLDEGRLYIFTAALPLHYQFQNQAAVWFTPIVSVVQRDGVEIAGFNLGGSFPVTRSLDLIGEVGANLVQEGNALIDDKREDVIPYAVGLRWHLSDLFGHELGDNGKPPALEFYFTNRVGSSPFHSLRVREDNDLAVGVGLLVPFRF